MLDCNRYRKHRELQIKGTKNRGDEATRHKASQEYTNKYISQAILFYNATNTSYTTSEAVRFQGHDECILQHRMPKLSQHNCTAFHTNAAATERLYAVYTAKTQAATRLRLVALLSHHPAGQRWCSKRAFHSSTTPVADQCLQSILE